MTEVPRDEVFRCSNRQLAFALAIAGAQWAPAELGGPAANTYSLGFLRQARFKDRFKGLDLTQSAIQLIKQGIPGNVIYAFQRGPILDEVIAAWDEMSKERTQAAADDRPPEMPTIDARAMAQVLFVAANSTDEFNKAPFINRMMQLGSTMDASSRTEQITRDGETLPGARAHIEGAGKVWSLFGRPALRDHLKV